MTNYKGFFFDGKSAQKLQVHVSFNDNKVKVHHVDREDEYEISECRVDSPIINLPISIKLPNGDLLEIEYSKELVSEIKKVSGTKKVFVLFLENHPFVSLGLIVSFFLILYVSYTQIIPGSTKLIVKFIPESVSTSIDKTILEQLDDKIFEKTQLEKRVRIDLEKFLKENTDKKINVQFRKGNQVGANAFALSHNTIVITDELLSVLDNKNQLLAIYFHELGHLEKKHVLKNLVSSSFLGALSYMIVGDMPGFSESILSLNYVLLARSYSRDYEKQADVISISLLKKKGLSSKCLSEGLKRLVGASRGLKHKLTKETENVEKNNENSVKSLIIKYFSTHPEIDERVEKINKGSDYYDVCKVAN